VSAAGRAVRRAWITLALQSTFALACVLVIVGGVAWLLLLHDESVSEHRLLEQAVRPAARDDVADPPPGISLFLVDRARRVVAVTPGTAARLFAPGDLRPSPSQPVWGHHALEGIRYRSLTVADGNGWAQAVLDLSGRDAERRRVLGVGLSAGLIGVLAAGAMGLLLARRAVAPLGEAIERQGRFVADASHELRTPLTLVHTRAQMVRRNLDAGDLEIMREEVAALERDTGRMGEVIEDLLLSAELGEGGTERVTVELAALTGEAVSSGRGEALLEVGDNGAGFDQAVAERLFDRFARGAGGAGRRRFGLGLALVREVVSAHGGRVEADGGHGGGATFRVRFPAAAPRKR
jgi:signal transduction histidine kinase